MFSVKYKLGFYIPEDDILHSHRSENLRSYTLGSVCTSRLGTKADICYSTKYLLSVHFF
jgi:hypothetical protein